MLRTNSPAGPRAAFLAIVVTVPKEAHVPFSIPEEDSVADWRVSVEDARPDPLSV